jgi:putative peptidoglycan lipid II flippase
MMSTNKSRAQASNRLILRFTSILSAGTLLSRILGFVRDVIFARMLGTAAMADAFFVAFKIPNMLRDLVGEGATNSAIVPIVSEYRQKKDQTAVNELISVIIVWALWILGIMTLLGILLAPFVVRLIAPGFTDDPHKLHTTIELTRIMFPYLILIGFTAYSMGVLYSYHSFAAPAFSACLLNVALIATTLMAGEYPEQAVYILAAGVLVGGLMQLMYQWIPLKTLGVRWIQPVTLNHEGARRIGRLLLPRVWGSAVYQSNVFVDTFCASLSMIVGPGGISAIYYATRLVQFPLGVFGVALASASLPTLSRLAANNDMDGFRQTVVFSLKNILFALLPSSIFLMVLARPIVRLLFERGEFTAYSTQITGDALFYFAFGLASFGVGKIVVSAFHSLQDTATPVKIALAGLLINIVLNFILMYPLKVGGIALASSICGTLNVLALFFILHKRLGMLGPEVGRFLLQMIAPLAVLLAAMLWSSSALAIGNAWIKLFTVGLAGALSFFLTAWAFKVEPAVAAVEWAVAKRRPGKP